MQEFSLELPTGHYLERDQEVLTLRRLDGAIVRRFSVRSAPLAAVSQTTEGAVREERSAQRRDAPISVAVQPSLRVRLFGQFQVLCDDGELIALGRNSKARSIIKYLLANHCCPVSKDYLMGWLWPESNLRKARLSLNTAIHYARRQLSEHPLSLPLNYILLEDGYYRLNSAVRVITDVEEFEAHYERGQSLEKEDQSEEAVAGYEKAVELYRNDYLVEDFYEDWTMVERERLSNAYLDILGRLGILHYEAERVQESIKTCYRVLKKDCCHENTFRLLMLCYARLGLRGRALEQYRLCEMIFKQKYGVAPTQETETLCRKILAGHL